MSHPSEIDLALIAGGELGAWRRFRLWRHVRSCDPCRREVEAFRAARESTSEAARELPGEVHWGRLAAEIKANIRLGLAAGECVGPVAETSIQPGWRVAASLASVMVLVLSGWWLYLPAPRILTQAGEPGVILEADASGIGLRENGASMTLMHGSPGVITLTANVQGSLGVRYFDTETGQITIHHVHAQ